VLNEEVCGKLVTLGKLFCDFLLGGEVLAGKVLALALQMMALTPTLVMYGTD